MFLDAKVPPPAIAAMAALLGWGISRLTPQLHIPSVVRLSLCLGLLAIGVAISAAGVLSFRRARTTLNPTKPDQASALVSSGIYQFTRNPMYLGMLLVLVAWTVFLSSAWALIGAAAFALYIDRFQIAPEERALARLFGDEYAAHKSSVRRWL